MIIEYDQSTDSMYIQFNDNAVTQTKSINNVVMIDLDAEGHPVQIEILSASSYGSVLEVTYKLLTEMAVK